MIARLAKPAGHERPAGQDRSAGHEKLKLQGAAQLAREVSNDYRRLGCQLLSRMAEGNLEAERKGEQIVLLKAGSRVHVAAGMPTGGLAGWLHLGAVRCASNAGEAVFTITDEGRASLRRDQAESDPFASQPASQPASTARSKRAKWPARTGARRFGSTRARIRWSSSGVDGRATGLSGLPKSKLPTGCCAI